MIVLDTHIWVWWVHGDARLSPSHRHLLEEHESIGLGICAISLWEVAQLVQCGRLVLPVKTDEWFQGALAYPGVIVLDLTPRIALESVPHTDRYRAQTPGEMEVDLTRTGAGTQSGGWLALLSCYFASGESVEEREAPLRRTLDRQGPTRWRQSAAPR